MVSMEGTWDFCLYSPIKSLSTSAQDQNSAEDNPLIPQAQFWKTDYWGEGWCLTGIQGNSRCVCGFCTDSREEGQLRPVGGPWGVRQQQREAKKWPKQRGSCCEKHPLRAAFHCWPGAIQAVVLCSSDTRASAEVWKILCLFCSFPSYPMYWKEKHYGLSIYQQRTKGWSFPLPLMNTYHISYKYLSIGIILSGALWPLVIFKFLGSVLFFKGSVMRKRERNFSSAGSLLKWLQQPDLGWARAWS